MDADRAVSETYQSSAGVFVVADGLVKRFEGRLVIDDLSFSVREGEITGLLGPNGSGKTTVVRLLNGLLRPDGGKALVAGLDPLEDGQTVRALSGVLTESAEFYRHMSGLDNLLFFGRLYGVQDEGRAHELLDTFGLGAHKHKRVGTYSTGMRKRLGLAKALLHRPKLLFLDEPTNGLDPEGVRLVLDHIKQLNERFGTTVFICSHLLNQMEEICHRYLFLDAGRLIESGPLFELRRRHHPTVEVEVEASDVAPPEDESIGFAKVQSVTGGSIGRWRIVYSLESKDDIPRLLACLTQKTAVYSARVMEPDLETLYFKVRAGREKS